MPASIYWRGSWQQQQQQQQQLNRTFDMSDSHSDNPQGKRGRLVTFYRNGDAHFKGLKASISLKAFVSMESLLVWLNEKIPTTAGVRCVFRLPDGKLMRDVTEFQPGGHYVVSSVQKLIRSLDYGTKGSSPNWRIKNPSAKVGKITREDIRLIRDAKAFADENEARSHTTESSGRTARQGGQRRTRVITVISNTHRSSREKVLINPSTQQNFEDLLFDFTNLLVMAKPPVQTLYTAHPPYRRVCSFSQLMRDFKDHDNFIACGREFAPVELGNKREAPPSSNSSEDAAAAAAAAAAKRDRRHRKFSKREEQDDRYQGDSESADDSDGLT